MWRFRSLAVATAFVAGLAAFSTSAAAQTVPPPTLTGETFLSCQPGNVGSVGIGCEAQGTRAIRVRCNSDQSGTISWTAFGRASGPYFGSFTESGTASFSPPTVPFGAAPLTNLQVTFHILSDLGEVDGRKFIASSSTALGHCAETTDSAGEDFVRGRVSGVVRYEAIIKPWTGGSFADEGTSQLDVLTSATEQEVDTSFGLVFEAFTSTLGATQPLLPNDKEQCKDEGFLIFGVFETQGDCVAFVSTHGKNEPGKNEPGTTTPPPPPPPDGLDSVAGSGTVFKGSLWTFSIDAHALAPSSGCAAATGVFSAQSALGTTIEGVITELFVSGPDAVANGTVTNSSDPSLIGYHLLVTLYDGGPPSAGTSPDGIDFQAVHADAQLPPCATVGDLQDVVAGDIVVVDAPPTQ
jgi:hypothetical protein